MFFTVTASNNGGGNATVSCEIPTYDVTLPAGRIEPAFRSTSHPYILEATAVVYDDSEIIDQHEAIGYGPGVWGDQIVPWTDATTTMRTHSGNTGFKIILNDCHFTVVCIPNDKK